MSAIGRVAGLVPEDLNDFGPVQDAPPPPRLRPRKRGKGRKQPHCVAEDVHSVVIAAAIYGSFDRQPLSKRRSIAPSPACGGGLGGGLSRRFDSWGEGRPPPPPPPL